MEAFVFDAEDELMTRLREDLRRSFERAHSELMSVGTGIPLERLIALNEGTAEPTLEETVATAKYLYGKEVAEEIHATLLSKVDIYVTLSRLSGLSQERLKELREGEDAQATLEEVHQLAQAMLQLTDQQLKALAGL